DVFNALASALRFDRTAHPNAQIPPLIVEYVAELATFWRQAGLRPTRATRVGDPTYRSKFHRFVDLVLTAMTEPSAQRHLINLDDLNDTRREIWLVHSRLPEEARRIFSPAPRRADVNWVISEDRQGWNPAATGVGRIDGVANVTGAKADLPGWPAKASHAMAHPHRGCHARLRWPRPFAPERCVEALRGGDCSRPFASRHPRSRILCR